MKFKQSSEKEKSGRLGFLDRFLTIWIFSAMVIGVTIGYVFKESSQWMNSLSKGTTNIPIALGLILMMYPPLVKVDFSKIHLVFRKPKLWILSFLVTWIVGPFLMFCLALIFLKDYPEYMTGLIIIGLAPCIAMVIVWNELADGNRELVAGLVGVNSILQVAFFSLYAYVYLEIILPYFGMKGTNLGITISEIAKTVAIYLGIPFITAIFSRIFLLRWKGKDWFTNKFLPFISPITLIALLLTIVIMFCLKGNRIVELPADVLLVATPLVIFFAIMFVSMFFLAKWFGATYSENAALSFTASGNNFELAIAVSIGVFGMDSGQAFAGVIGPLVEVPALILMVQLARRLRKKLYS